MCVHTCARMCAHKHSQRGHGYSSCVYVWRPEVGICCLPLLLNSTLFFDTLNLTYSILVDSVVGESLETLQIYTVILVFYMRLRDLNLGPHACTASILPLEPWP